MSRCLQIVRSALCTGLLATISLWTLPAAAEGRIEIITHADRAEISLDQRLLRVIFTMRLRQWPDGRPTRVFVLPDTDPAHQQFCRQTLGTFPYVLRGVWDRLVFTGTGFAPEVVDDFQEMRARVDATPGAIGYIVSSGGGATPAADLAQSTQGAP